MSESHSKREKGRDFLQLDVMVVTEFCLTLIIFYTVAHSHRRKIGECICAARGYILEITTLQIVDCVYHIPFMCGHSSIFESERKFSHPPELPTSVTSLLMWYFVFGFCR